MFFVLVLVAALAVPASAAKASTLITQTQFGDTSNNVIAVQKILISKGFLNASASGYFGSATFAAVKAFQKANSITITGAIGPKTAALMNSTPPWPMDIKKTTSVAPSTPDLVSNSYVVGFCQSLTKSGLYSMAGDITTKDSACLRVDAQKSITLDCSGHHVAAVNLPLSVSSSSDVTFNNCYFDATNKIDEVGVNVKSSKNIKFANSFFNQNQKSSKFYVRVNNSSGSVFSKNSIFGMLDISSGTNDSITGNLVSGGCNHGISVVGETSGEISSNTIKDVTDCAISISSSVSKTNFQSNNIKNAASAGICSGLSGTFVGNLFKNNVVLQSGSLYKFATPVSDQTNTFSGNIAFGL